MISSARKTGEDREIIGTRGKVEAEIAKLRATPGLDITFQELAEQPDGTWKARYYLSYGND